MSPTLAMNLIRQKTSLLAYDSLPCPDKRFDLKEVIGTGVCSKVYRAIDKDANGKSVR